MTPEQFIQLQRAFEKQLEKGLAIGIEKHVNGKIRKLDEKIDAYIKEDLTWKEKDKAWKDNAQPTITLGSSAINWWNFTKWIIGTIVIVSGLALAIQAIKELFK